MYCRYCGNKLGRTDKFCSRCGSKVIVTPHEREGLLPRNAPMRELATHNKGRFWLIDVLLSLAYMLVPEIVLSILLMSFVVPIAFLRGDLSFIDSVTSGQTGTILNLGLTLPVLITVLIFWRYAEKKSLSSMGFRRKGIVRSYIVGLLIGFLTLFASWLIAYITGSITCDFEGISLNNLPIFIVIFVLFLIQGMEEEVVCRGYLMNCMTIKYPVVAAIMVNAVFFGMLHLANPGVSVLAVINLILYGIFASLYYYHTENLWGVGALHSMWNFTQGNLLGVSVSGMDSGPTLIATDVVAGKQLINGGSFGLEGGLAVTVVEVVSIVVMTVLIVRKHRVS